MMVVKNEKGIAIPLVMLVITVMMLFGTAMYYFSTTDTVQVSRDVKKIQAYYVAKSGVDATASWIIEEFKHVDELSLPLNGTGSLDNGTFNVSVDVLDSGLIKIISVGTVGNVKETVTLTLSQQGLFDNALFGTAFIALKGKVTVVGNIESNGPVSYTGNSYIHEGNTKEWSDRNYPSVIFPSNTSTAVIEIKNNDKHIIDSNQSINKININNGGTLEFVLNNSVLKVVVNEIDAKGKVIVKGTGTLILYTKEFIAGGNAEIINETGSTASLIVLLPPNGVINFGGSPSFHGVVYGPDSTASFSGDTSFSGAVVSGDIINNGNPTIVYDHELKDLTPDHLQIEGIATGFLRKTWNKY